MNINTNTVKLVPISEIKKDTWQYELNDWVKYKRYQNYKYNMFVNSTNDILHQKMYYIFDKYPNYNWLLLKCLKNIIFCSKEIKWPLINIKIWKIFRHSDMFYQQLFDLSIKSFYYQLQIILWKPIIKEAITHRLYSFPNGLRIPEIKKNFEKNKNIICI